MTLLLGSRLRVHLFGGRLVVTVYKLRDLSAHSGIKTPFLQLLGAHSFLYYVLVSATAN